MSTIKNILSKISIHPSCYFLIVLSLLSGYFNLITITTILLLIHECGHFFTAYFFNWEVDKIVFYPYGGVSKFNHEVNCPIKEELIVLLMGAIMQLGCYLVLMNIPYLYNYQEIIKTINYSILLFNLLPIYPLDGSKLYLLLLELVFSFYSSYRFLLLFSLVFAVFFVIWTPFHLTFLLMTLFLLKKVIEELFLLQYTFSKFLLERYLTPVSYHHYYKIKNRNIKKMKREKTHLFYIAPHWLHEKEFLQKWFDK